MIEIRDRLTAKPVYLDHAAASPLRPVSRDTLAAHADLVGNPAALHGAGRAARALLEDAREIGVERIFCLTFETDFFTRHGFTEIEGRAVDPEVYAELLRSYDEGVAEFLDLERVKPNTLGNTRMLLVL